MGGPAPPNEAHMQIKSHYDSIDAMIAAADCISLGYFDSLKETWNMRRDPQDPSQPAKDDYAEGEIYRFRNLMLVKWEENCDDALSDMLVYDNDNILVNIPHTERISNYISNAKWDETGKLISPATETDPFTFDAVRSYYMKPDLGELVMIFLAYDEVSNLFHPAVEPYVIVLNSPTDLRLKSNFLETAEGVPALKPQYFTSKGGQLIEYRSSIGEPIQDNISGVLTLADILGKIGIDPPVIAEDIAVLHKTYWDLPENKRLP